MIFVAEWLPEYEKRHEIPSCPACQAKQAKWEEGGTKRRTKHSPVELRMRKEFFYPRPGVVEGRIRGCARGWVWGCPILGTAPRHSRLLHYVDYYPHWSKGIDYEAWRNTPMEVSQAMQAIETGMSRYQERSLKKEMPEPPATSGEGTENR